MDWNLILNGVVSGSILVGVLTVLLGIGWGIKKNLKVFGITLGIASSFAFLYFCAFWFIPLIIPSHTKIEISVLDIYDYRKVDNSEFEKIEIEVTRRKYDPWGKNLNNIKQKTTYTLKTELEGNFKDQYFVLDDAGNVIYSSTYNDEVNCVIAKSIRSFRNKQQLNKVYKSN